MIDQILDWHNLEDAWNDVRAGKGAAGVDRVSVKRWGRNWEERLVELRRAVMANTYRPAPLERYSVPKKSGGRRHLANLTVTDKVLQRAVLNVLDGVFDPLFLPCSYGYRKGRSAAGAVESICAHRDAGFTWVLDGDIDECFDSLDHGLLMRFVRQQVDHPIVLRLIESWLRVGRPIPTPRGASRWGLSSRRSCATSTCTNSTWRSRAWAGSPSATPTISSSCAARRRRPGPRGATLPPRSNRSSCSSNHTRPP